MRVSSESFISGGVSNASVKIRLIGDATRPNHSYYTVIVTIGNRRWSVETCHFYAMELAANKSKTMSKSGTIQAFIKDIFV